MKPQTPNHWLKAHLALRGGSERPRIVISHFTGQTAEVVADIALERTRPDLFEILEDWPYWPMRFRPPFPFPFPDGEELTHELTSAARRAGQTYLDNMPAGARWTSLPLFAICDRPYSSPAWAEIIRWSLASQRELPVPVEVIDAPDVFVEAPRPLQLPVRITGVGGPSVRRALESLERQAWYFREREVQEFALRVESQPQEDWQSLKPGALGDIVVTSDADGRDFLRRLTESMERSPNRPRLIIVLNRREPPSFWRTRNRFPNGVAVAFIPVRGAQSASEEDLRWFIEEIVHDWPLHDAMHVFRRNRFSEELRRSEVPGGDYWWQLPILHADPATNQSLRLSSGLPQVMEAASRLHSFSQERDIGQFSMKMESVVGAQRARQLEEFLSRAQQAAAPYRQARSRSIVFDQEGQGLVPMARLAAAAAQLSASQEQFAQQLDALVREPGMAEALEKVQERKVDATLFERTPDGSAYPVSGVEGLKPGMALRLSIHIGQRADGSLVIGDTPALDPLLPLLQDDQPHALDIVVFPKDFRLESAAVQTVKLSRFGGTAAVEWDLLAPKVRRQPPTGEVENNSEAVDVSKGRGWVVKRRAELRFSIYYKNQLLQSFCLRAVLGRGRVIKEGRRVIIECDFSQTRRFGSLDKLGARAISIGLNRDANTSHTLTIVKDNQQPVSLAWTEGQMAAHTEAIREALHDVTALEKKPNPFPFDTATLNLKSSPSLAFANAVHTLADAGARLHTQLFLKNQAAQELLKSLSATSGEVMQIARHDADYAFPWPLLYDFERPMNGSSQTVCLGRDAQGNICKCQEQESPTSWCLRGFWGFRHIIEQLCDGPTPLDNVPGKIADKPVSPALGVVPVVKDAFVDSWLGTLAPPPLAPHEGSPTPPPKFLYWLRDASKRPHLVVFIGHHSDQRPGGIPDPQLAMDNGTTVLRLDDFKTEMIKHGKWQAPRSLVLLLACGSGTGRVDTGTSLAAALLQLGAVGVLATECTVRTGIVSRMARDLTSRLAVHEKMGHAMRETIFKLAVEGCPLGLAFTYLGSADAQLPK